MKEKKFTPPANLAACADLLYKTRQERFKADKAAAALKSKETALVEHLIAKLPKSSATGIAGKLALAKVQIKNGVEVVDFDKTYAYIAKNWKKGAFALLQRRISTSTVEEMWEAGKEVPGCKRIKFKTISLTKRS